MESPTTKSSLPGIGQLLSQSITGYKTHWKLFVWIILLPILATIAVVAVVGGVIAAVLAVSGGEFTTDRLPLLIPPALVGIVSLAIINSLGKIGLIKAIELKGQTKVKQLIKLGWPLVGKYIILQLLVGITVLVGFVLLVIPGILFMVWFLFPSMILVVEGTSGTAAMKRSKLYVKGKFWGILGRMLVVIVAIAGVAGVASSIDNQMVTGVFQLISTFVIAPITTIYMFKLYQGAKGSS